VLRISLKALEHDSHDKALRSVGATRFNVLVSESVLEIPNFPCLFCIYLTGLDDGMDNDGLRRDEMTIRF
jgi:hypothetical protein